MSIRKAICTSCRNLKPECVCDITCDECGKTEAQCTCGRDLDPFGNPVISEREWQRELEDILGVVDTPHDYQGKYTLGGS